MAEELVAASSFRASRWTALRLSNFVAPMIVDIVLELLTESRRAKNVRLKTKGNGAEAVAKAVAKAAATCLLSHSAWGSGPLLVDSALWASNQSL